ncbi:hypothetical protein CTI12_AA317570 [Artemisia annua]|uniref:B box-type domain-containing protein n=1 Tax=Artemisia annua TaxID=35608 RepID=A0A2U1N1K8_ARTAN|nr:hypothetical protein CTI12_AA317570 [Artemisia annua]
MTIIYRTEVSAVLWIFLFLERTFFVACRTHIIGNNLNRYCIDCNLAACRNCISEKNHADHRVISIYRLTHQDVVAVDEINQHIDCTGIQPYSSNGRLVLSLRPLPHRNSGSLKKEISCHTCMRRLMEPTYYSFCSLACKFQNSNLKPKTKKRTPRVPKPDNGSNAGPSRNKCSSSGASRRKGVPVRSPLC